MAKLVSSDKVVGFIMESLEDGKAIDTSLMEVGKVSSFTDYMIVSSGRSIRQVKSLVKRVKSSLSVKGIRPIGIEGENVGEWVLLDYGDVIVHVMQPSTREFYQLEKLWGDPGGPRRKSKES